MIRALESQALSGPVLSNSRTLIDYLALEMAHLPAERLRVLFLDCANRLLGQKDFEGSVGEVPIYPREIVRRSLELGASAIILAHNHPSGDPSPSEADIRGTRRVAEALRIFEIRLHDHLIIGKSGWSSFRALGLL
jgi:DNA repair protein RadC